MTILIDNFSFEVGEWLPTDDLVYFFVDVIDYSHELSTSGTYFIHDGSIVSTSFSGISDGYRCYYTPSGIYSDGTINLTIHAENVVSGVAEQTFRFLYGYNWEFNELVDWGPNKEVEIKVEATNLAFCPNTEGEATYFETADLHSHGLSATILPVEPLDLGADVYPQNTFFFYGRTYTVTIVDVKDFAGNKLAPYTFTFTIEDPTN